MNRLHMASPLERYLAMREGIRSRGCFQNSSTLLASEMLVHIRTVGGTYGQYFNYADAILALQILEQLLLEKARAHGDLGIALAMRGERK